MRLGQRVRLLDAVGPSPETGTTELEALHRRFFPGHPHVLEEYAEAAASGYPDRDVIAHNWVIEVDAAAMGLLVVHASLRRRVGIIHFLALDPRVRRLDGRPLADDLLAPAQSTVTAEALQRGVSLIGFGAESDPRHVDGWIRRGFRPCDVAYLEPCHGRSWPRHGELTFFAMVPVIRTAGGSSDGEVAVAVVEAFLIDHYGLPAAHPAVARPLALAAALGSVGE